MKKILAFFTLALTAPLLFAQEKTSAEKLGWQVAIHSYTYRLFSIDDAIAKTAGLGLNHMSISGSVNLYGATNTLSTPSLSNKDLAVLQEKLKKGGIAGIVNMGVVTLTTNEAQGRKIFDFAKRAGIDTLVSEPKPEALDTVEKLCKEYNIKVAIHNHPKPSFYWNPDTVLTAIKGRSPLIGACADTGHWVRSGLDPLECLKKLDGHIITLHFKDLSEKSPKAHDVPWGTGVSDVKAMMTELKRQGFHGTFCVEYEYHWTNSTPEIAKSIKTFNDTCDELVK